ncbi:MarR family transcriptional regulator [Halorientalis brevis]|uniref:MarR family transcriptional regulator n=1 Tax=Halorientalis brevis TaxID=1126241 RepID=A0ABD6CFG8_9EURY|nr:helix-turn-helix domain-containing protein [Halorientalis brevis]
MSTSKPRVSTEQIINQFESSDDAFLTAPEIAEALGTDRQAINYRLKKLHSKGILRRKEAGSRAVGWWMPEN